MCFDAELKVYRDNLEKWADEEGKWVAIQGDQIAGIWTSYEDAVKAAYRQFGTDDGFLVKRIEKVETIQFVSVGRVPCRS